MDNLNCITLNSAIHTMVDEFVEKYYEVGAFVNFIDRREWEIHYNLQINDDFRNIADIYTALWCNITKEQLFARLDYSLESYLQKRKNAMNMENFLKSSQLKKYLSKNKK